MISVGYRDRRHERFDVVDELEGAFARAEAERRELCRLGRPPPHRAIAHGGRPARHVGNHPRQNSHVGTGRSGRSDVYRTARTAPGAPIAQPADRDARCKTEDTACRKPDTNHRLATFVSSSKANSAATTQSRQSDAGMTGPGPSWPGNTGAADSQSRGLERIDQRPQLVRSASQSVQHQAHGPPRPSGVHGRIAVLSDLGLPVPVARVRLARTNDSSDARQ